MGYYCVASADNLEKVIQKLDYSVVVILYAAFRTKVEHASCSFSFILYGTSPFAIRSSLTPVT